MGKSWINIGKKYDSFVDVILLYDVFFFRCLNFTEMDLSTDKRVLDV